MATIITCSNVIEMLLLQNREKCVIVEYKIIDREFYVITAYTHILQKY